MENLHRQLQLLEEIQEDKWEAQAECKEVRKVVRMEDKVHVLMAMNLNVLIMLHQLVMMDPLLQVDPQFVQIKVLHNVLMDQVQNVQMAQSLRDHKMEVKVANKVDKVPHKEEKVVHKEEEEFSNHKEVVEHKEDQLKVAVKVDQHKVDKEDQHREVQVKDHLHVLIIHNHPVQIPQVQFVQMVVINHLAQMDRCQRVPTNHLQNAMMDLIQKHLRRWEDKVAKRDRVVHRLDQRARLMLKLTVVVQQIFAVV